MLRTVLKNGFFGLFLMLSFPMALLSGFGRVEASYLFFAQVVSLVPGIVGDYLRIAYYVQTLKACHSTARIQFGSFFAHSDARLGPKAYIGSNCILGHCSIGERVHIAAAVQILSGARQHGRDAEGRILGGEEGTFRTVTIGDDSWIGAGCILMADVGERVTIGAGSVVTRPIPSDTTAVGVPARVISGRLEGKSKDGEKP